MIIEVRAKGGSSAEFKAGVDAAISQAFGRYGDRVIRVEVHFEDANGPKGGVDHQCRLEARLAGLNPLVVSNVAQTTDEALHGTIGKMERLLASTLGKLDDQKGASASGEST
jgi:hypothetical protein